MFCCQAVDGRRHNRLFDPLVITCLSKTLSWLKGRASRALFQCLGENDQVRAVHFSFPLLYLERTEHKLSISLSTERPNRGRLCVTLPTSFSVCTESSGNSSNETGGCPYSVTMLESTRCTKDALLPSLQSQAHPLLDKLQTSSQSFTKASFSV